MKENHLLEAIPDSLFSANYTVYENNNKLAEMQCKLMSLHMKGRINVDGSSYQIYRDGILSRQFKMENIEGNVVASAKLMRVINASLLIEYGGNTLVLKKKFFSLMTRFQMYSDTNLVGEVRLKKLFSRRLLFETFKEFPLEIVMFVFWMAMMIIISDSSD